MQFGDPARVSHCKWPSAFCCGLLLLAIGAFRSPAQDVAEAARQEKARKAADAKPSRHVYTDEDLKRAVILTPEDRARLEAHRIYSNPGPLQQNAEKLPDNNELSESLGEIARRYREEKAAREAELAVQKRFTPFLYISSDTTLAAPAPAVEPLTAPEAAVPSARNHSNSVFKSNHPVVGSRARVSPFQPRPIVGAPSLSPASAAPSIALPARVPEAPSATSNAVVPSSSAGLHRVQVQHGQSWWKLAQLYLGNGARWREVRALNPPVSESSDVLELGRTVVVPDGTPSPKPLKESKITVSQGDSLWSLALRYFGRGSAWHCLARANPQVVDYTRLGIGTSLQLPQADALKSCVGKPAEEAE